MKRTSLVDVAVEKLNEYISVHQYENGDKLPSERKLIEQLGVSRTVVREAISRLQQSGLIQVKSGSGMFITDKNKHLSMLFESHMKVHGFEIKELLEVRKILELGALRLIIENNLTIDFNKLRSINNHYYHSKDDVTGLAEADSAFHESIILFTENQTLITMTKVIKEYFAKNQFNQVVKEGEIVRSFEEHKDIIESLERGDLVASHDAINKHLSHVFKWITELEQNK
ncbi:FadR/GntR family transcriptional regulator [Mammaliicoccus stepanovicii]|uniref:GntR family transcriptional regulator n=1 Tax=Mammaliicoccus stepanovicii TaxID=643214 RepID=A0A239YHH4_9STAP|nr:GntR family transcriptional regulator [Mammaliicoccus stepanovicii]PNZ77874.1 FadR family transcriptional regulator [Mammaliicoccus stepanovicii]GGI40921.1 GntR family transcriptional regulator [Mammaliicoccus stepanovicii]SNV58701.1 GntR family transcriptional regulator [Mammaliicoccus stepanovicii]